MRTDSREKNRIFFLILFGMKIALVYNENEERSETMKKQAVILSVVILAGVFLTSCAVIDHRYTGKRIQVAPGEYEYRDSAYPGDNYDPYYSYYYDPFFWTGLSFWNPFWHFGFVNYWSYGWYPYYWGYYPYYWGYYPSYWGGWYNYPGWEWGYYPSSRYRTNYKYTVRKNQLSRTGSYRTPTVQRRTDAGKKSTSIKSRSLAPSSRTSSVSTRTSSISRTASRSTIKKKK